MRAMEFQARPDSPAIRLEDLDQSIGQYQHAIPNVFSFFAPNYVPPGPIGTAKLVSPESKVMNTPTIIGIMNGFLSLINFGLTSCYGGFGMRTTWWCPDYEIGDPENLSKGHLLYKPHSFDADTVVDELSTLLTAGRLSENSRKIIKSEYIKSMNNYGKNAALRMAQKLFVSTPEFHSTNIIDTTGEIRAEPKPPHPSNKPYKAIVFIMLDGGLDSFNMLVPHSGCGSKDMYQEYSNIRGSLALSKDSLLKINAKNQPCTAFGLHPNLPSLHKLYNDKNALFAANIGVLTEVVTKEDWWKKTDGKTSLFDHDGQQKEVKKVDVFGKTSGTGMLGRLAYELSLKGFEPVCLSIEGVSEAVQGILPTIVLSSSGIEPFDPSDSESTLGEKVKNINTMTTTKSGLFGETWSSFLHDSLAENKLLHNILEDISIDSEFPDTHLGNQLKIVAKLIKTAKERGTDRDVFYVELGGFDSHNDLTESLQDRFTELDDALDIFVKELKEQNIWESITSVISSEFSRTLTPNTSAGSDHSWGGHYVVFGGDINGGKILGDYPDNLTSAGPLIIDRGRVIPSSPWDSVWNPIAEWFGITGEDDLNKVLPNRNNFKGMLFPASEMFLKSTIICSDTKGKFSINSKGKMKNCSWVKRKKRCKSFADKCPKSCNAC